METAKLKKFAQFARKSLIEQIRDKLHRVLSIDSGIGREHATVIRNLEQAIAQNDGEEKIIEKIAYVWFNRFCALRFMDINRYNSIGILSPLEGQFQPEILAEAKKGYIDREIVPDKIANRIHGLLNGVIPSKDPQNEAYGLLIISSCNYYHSTMPYLFENIDDYTELLLPDDLLSNNSIIVYTREALTPETCQNVEIIGWLYQFYISEKKDEVFDGLKKNKKITPENIPAATQLFTPHWIVRYLVENSLGRLWMLNHPKSNLVAHMDYYIRPELPEFDFLNIKSPEEIKICDPACGSGHMLVYAFDLLYAMYDEEGYDAADIPAKILTHNLYGIEIDERAGELAAFALTMKAQSKQRNFFLQQIRPNVCVLENVKFESEELKNYMNVVGRDLFTMQLQNTLHQFEEADNFGSLIRPDLIDVEPMYKFLDSKNLESDLQFMDTHKKVMKVLNQADYLCSKYHVVVANPPYMSGSGMNGRLSSWVKDNYPESKADLFSVFIERNLALTQKAGLIAMITMQSWMFLSSFEKIRSKIIDQGTILSMAHLGAKAFDSIGGEVVSTTAFIVRNQHLHNFTGTFLRLIDGENEASKDRMIIESANNQNCMWVFKAIIDDFKKIPGSPIAYWVSERVRDIFANGIPFKDIGNPKVGMQTSNNDKYLRFWFEVIFREFIEQSHQPPKWIKYLKGGQFRRWYGNLEYLLRYNRNPNYIKQQKNATLMSESALSAPKCTWTDLTSGLFNVRLAPDDSFHDISGHCFYPQKKDQLRLLGYVNSKQFDYFLSIVNSSFHFQVGDIGRMPVMPFNDEIIDVNTNKLVNISKSDWDNYENSWDFAKNPLVKNLKSQKSIKKQYCDILFESRILICEMKQLEEENNRIFIEAYGLQNELSPEIPLSEITLTCNPHYRYGGNKTESELEALLLADTMREFISYAVGCMFGRYSLDKPGLVLANRGETLADYLAQIPSPMFMPDEDNVIPILDGEWFADDIVDRFRMFLRVTFGDEHFAENLKFIEDAIGKDIRKFFLTDFYTDHLKRYKKRPIYWLFSSPKGSFNALIYMHRYRPDTVSIVLNKYLREFKLKLSSRIEHLNRLETSINTSKADKTRAIKEREALKKNLDELDVWERDVLFPLALEQKEIDLDDGVKANYPKFGAALKKIPGLEAAED